MQLIKKETNYFKIGRWEIKQIINDEDQEYSIGVLNNDTCLSKDDLLDLYVLIAGVINYENEK